MSNLTINLPPSTVQVDQTGVVIVPTAAVLNFVSGFTVTQDPSNPLQADISTSGGGSGTVTSVGLALPASVFTVTGSPVTTAGTLTGSFISQTANTFFAAPNGSSGVPTFRAIVTADLPAGTGTVTSVALTTPVEFTISGSPITTSGTLAITKANETANTVWAGPTTGAAAQPTFRALVTADLPAGTGTVTSVAFSDGSTTPIYTITGSPVTTSGTLTETLKTQSANTVFAGPTTGAAAQPTFRAIVAADLPTGNLTDVGTDGIVITGGTGAVIGSGTSLAQHVADTTHNGYLSSTDWNTFNGKQAAGNYITALTGDVTATGPGSVAATLATVNGSPGTFTYSTVTVNGKGLVTAASSGTAPVTTMSAFGSSPNANAATITGNNLTLQPASGSFPGGVSTTTQTFAGSKTLGNAASDATTIGAASSTALHQINGGLQGTTRTITANLTVDTTTTDYIILCNQSGGITVTLPAPTNGRILIIKDISGTANTNNITIARHASESIEGIAASKILQTNWGSFTLTSDGTNWFLV